MASKLLNVLNEIEQGRKNLVNKAIHAGYNLTENASFDDLSGVFDEIPTTDNRSFVEEHIQYTKRGTWQKPSDWPDVYTILKNAQDIGNYAPCSCLLLDNTFDTSTFSVADLSTTLMDGSYLRLGNYQYTSSSYTVYFKIVTSDGVVLDVKGNPANERTVTHTWDTSKDINGRYRWILVYLSDDRDTVGNKHTGTSLTNICYGARFGAFHTLSMCIACHTWERYQSSTITDEDSFKSSARYYFSSTTKELIFIDPTTVNAVRVNQLLPYNNQIIAVTGGVANGQGDSFVNISSVIAYTPCGVNLQYRLPLLDTLDLKNPNANYNGSNLYVPKLLVVRNKAVDYLGAVYQNTNGYSNNGPQVYNPVFRIEEYDDGYPIYGTDTAIGYSGSNSYAYYKFYNKNIEQLPANITELRAFVFAYACPDVNTLDLNNIQSITGNYTFQFCGAKKILLNNLTMIQAEFGENSKTQFLEMDSLPTLNYSSAWPGLMSISLASCTEITTNNIFGNRNLMNIYAPSCVRANATAFNGPALMYLTVGQDFESDLNLTKCINLTMQSLTDLFNKLKDFSEDNNLHTITLSQKTYGTAYDVGSILEIATNKGWTVSM